MKTATVNGKRENISFRTDSRIYTRYSYKGKCGQYGADVYDVDNNKSFVVLVATASNGSTLKSTTKVVSKRGYEKLQDIQDPYNSFVFHSALMGELGFHNAQEEGSDYPLEDCGIYGE